MNKMIVGSLLHESTIWSKKPDYQTIDRKKREELMSSYDDERRFSADFILKAMFWGLQVTYNYTWLIGLQTGAAGL